MSKLLTTALAGALAFGGLAACHGSRDVVYAGQIHVASADLVALEPGSDVRVIADSEDPIFYSNDAYFMWRNNRWYRAANVHGDWVHVQTVPDRLRHIDRPLAYAHFRVHTNRASR